MKAAAKFQGTRYVVQVRKTSSGDWSLDLLVNEALEDSKALRSLSMRNITEGVNEFVKKHNINTNHIITDNLVKKLYQDASGDTSFEQHNQTEKELEMKKNLTSDPAFQQSLVSEFNQTIGKQVTPMKVDKSKDKKDKHDKKVDAPKPIDPEMKNLVSEMGKMIGAQPTTQPKPADTPAATHSIPTHVRTAEPKPSSGEVDELMYKIVEEQSAIRVDLDRMSKRLENIENLMVKLRMLLKS